MGVVSTYWARVDAARGFAVVQADLAFAIEVEAHLELCLAQHGVVVLQVRQIGVDFDAGQLSELDDVLAVAADR
eukprot:11208-Eustigmatos_ZCMA.PRE.1